MDHEIAFEPDETGGGRYVMPAVEAEGEHPELVWRRREGAMVIVHTGVPTALEGHGLARKLFDRAVADARAWGLKIDPRCSYAEAQFARRPDLSDLRA